MKYLNSYKIFESESLQRNEIKLDIDHILCELSDIGFETSCDLWRIRNHIDTHVHTTKKSQILSFQIAVAKSYDVPDGQGGLGSMAKEEIKWEDIEDVIQRLCDYLFTVSSTVMFTYEDANEEAFAHTNWRCGNSKGLVSVFKKQFPKYYHKEEGWFRIELDVVKTIENTY